MPYISILYQNVLSIFVRWFCPFAHVAKRWSRCLIMYSTMGVIDSHPGGVAPREWIDVENLTVSIRGLRFEKARPNAENWSVSAILDVPWNFVAWLCLIMQKLHVRIKAVSLQIGTIFRRIIVVYSQFGCTWYMLDSKLAVKINLLEYNFKKLYLLNISQIFTKPTGQFWSWLVGLQHWWLYFFLSRIS